MAFENPLLAKWRAGRPTLGLWCSTANPAQANSPREYFIALPLLIEEDDKFYNHDYDDGSWAWYDQVTERQQQQQPERVADLRDRHDQPRDRRRQVQVVAHDRQQRLRVVVVRDRDAGGDGHQHDERA